MSDSTRSGTHRLSIDDELAALRATYADTLADKLTALEGAVHLIVNDDASGLDSAITKSHRIRGTAGSYGFDTLGNLAGELEDALLDMKSRTATSKAEWADIHTLLAQLQTEAAVATGTLHRTLPGIERSAVSVLVVDDDPEILRFLKTTSIGLPVVLHTSGSIAAALDLASRVRIDGAVVDVHLERPSFDLATGLREVTGNCGLPIAFLSGDNTLETRVRAAHVGAVAFIDKPVNPEEFFDAVENMIRESRRGRDTILIVDDDPDFIAATEQILLSHGYDVLSLQDAAQILTVLEEHGPDALLLDMNMPRYTGAEICAALRASERWSELPIVFATANADLSSRIAAFEAGADDYLLKPFVEAELLARLRHRLERAQLVRERIERDPHSGLLRRQAFLERFRAILSAARRKRRSAALCLVDLDRFKQVNDVHGHLAGDEVISAFGTLLKNRFRAEDVRGRWGGEEFVLAFAEEDLATIEEVMAKVLREFSLLGFDGLDGPFSVTFSAGVAEFPRDGRSPRELLAAADRRLYTAKTTGRARIVSTD
jgi:diguanylate cyclase (GGDEF)-like protein